MTGPKTLIIVPALNEARGLRYVIPKIPVNRLEARGLTVSVLVVDGHSTDGTRDLAKALGAKVDIHFAARNAQMVLNRTRQHIAWTEA